MARAIAQLCVLTGSLDVPGGNVLFAGVPVNRIDGAELLSPAQRAKALGLAGPPARAVALGIRHLRRGLRRRARRPALQGARRGRLRRQPGDGACRQRPCPRCAQRRSTSWSMPISSCRPTAELADIVLPVASAFETEALRVGFEVSEAAQAHLQLRQRVVPPRGEARSDLAIVFALADRLGLGDRFFGGDVEAALASPDRAERDHARGAPRPARRASARRSSRATGSTPRPATACPRASRRRRGGSSSTRRRCSTTATRRSPNSTSRASRRARVRDLAARFPADSHLGQGHAFLRDAAPQRPEPPPSRARPAGRAPSRPRRRPRHRRRRLGADIDPGRQRPRSRPAE